MYLVLLMILAALVQNTKGLSQDESVDGIQSFDTEDDGLKSDPEETLNEKVLAKYKGCPNNSKVCSDFIGELFYCYDPESCENQDEGLAILSYESKCAKCLGSVKGWILYLFLATFPTSVFFLVVYGCGIKATSAPMNALVCLTQIALYNMNMNLEYYSKYLKNSLSGAYVMLDLVSIWNLDFLRYSIPVFCINEHLKTMHVLAMEYIVAIYPLVCIASLYICIELHDRDFKPLVLLWKPFRWCLAKSCFKNYNPKTSIIEVFATFLLLAYSKLLFTSFNLIAFITLYTKSSNESDANISASQRMLYDISVPYLGSDHLPFFILANLILFLFNILPFLLLLLYPTKLFQKALGCCTRVRWHPLHAFADAFQGHFKISTNGTRDFRYFAALYLLFRALHRIPGFFVFTDSPTNGAFFVFLCFSFSMLFGIMRPYQDERFNKLDQFFFFLAPLGQVWFIIHRNTLGFITDILIGMLFLIYYAYIAIYKTLSMCAPRLLESCKSYCTQNPYACIEQFRRKLNRNEYNPVNDENDVIDRIENPQDYQRLVVTVSGRHEDGESGVKQESTTNHSHFNYGTI